MKKNSLFLIILFLTMLFILTGTASALDCTDAGSDGVLNGIITVTNDGTSNCNADGVNDEVEIQTAINNGTGKTVYIKGTTNAYMLSSEILVDVSNIIIKGDYNKTTLNMASSLSRAFKTSISGVNNITYSGFRLTGSVGGRWFGWNDPNAAFSGPSNYIVENMIDVSDAGLMGYGSVQVSTGSHDVIVRNNIKTGSGYLVLILWADGIQIYNNTLKTTSTSATNGIDMNRNVYHATIRDNYLVGPYSGNEMLRLHGGNGYYFQIYNNVIANTYNGASNLFASVYNDGIKDSRIYNNTIYGNSACLLWEGAASSRNITFDHNVVYGCKDGIYTKDGTYLMDDTHFNNNIWYGFSNDGIYIHDTSSKIFTFSNNLIINSGRYNVNIGLGTQNNFNYNDIWGAGTADYSGTVLGTGNINADPLFANPPTDFHLKSQAGRYTSTGWVYTDTVTSPAIDAGDPTFVYSLEPVPNGNRINMGAYGNTVEASKSVSSCNSYVPVNPGDSIQAAIDTLCSTGGTIQLAAGTHIVASTINVNKSNIIIAGAGDATLIDSILGSTVNLFDVSGTNLAIGNFKLQTNTNNAGHAFQIHGANTVLIHDINATFSTINRFDGFVFGTGSVSYNLEIRNNIMGRNNFKRPMLFTRTVNTSVYNNKILGSTMGHCIDYNWEVEGNTGDIFVYDNIINHCTNSGIKIYVGTYPKLKVYRNTISDAQTGIHLNSQGGGEIYNNTIHDLQLGYGGLGVENAYSYKQNTTFRNNVIYNSDYGIVEGRLSGTGSGAYSGSTMMIFDGNSFYNIKYGVYTTTDVSSAYVPLLIKNNVFGNIANYGINKLGTGTILHSYNIFYGTGGAYTNYNGESQGVGELLGLDSLFANPPTDFHLKSQAGRYTPIGWVYTDAQTSPAIAAGDPTSDNSKSPWGGRIEMGAYGNTAEASKSYGGAITPVLTREGNIFKLDGVAISQFGIRAGNALESDTATQTLINNLDSMKAHGIQSVVISLQGAKTGTAEAFNSDGSLNSVYTNRLASILDALSARGMVGVVAFFYQARDQDLVDDNAVRAATTNATNFLKPWRNVWLQVINEWYHTGFDRAILKSSSGQAELYNLVKSIDPQRITHVSDTAGTNDGFLSDTGYTQSNGNIVIEYTRQDLYTSEGGIPGSFSGTGISAAQNDAQTTFNNNGYWFWHAAWHQQADSSGWPRFDEGGAGTNTDPGVSFIWNKMQQLSAPGDTIPPAIISAALATPGIVTIVYSEPVDSATSTNIANYAISSGITISSAALGADQKTVTISTSSHTEGTTYTITVNNVKDIALNTIAANTQATYQYSSTLAITNIVVSNGKAYTTDTLAAGKLQYIDRTFTFSSVPAAYDGLNYILTANDDKALTTNPFLTFDVNKNITVFVAYDDRITPRPAWMSSYTDTADNLVSGGGTYSLYAKNYTVGYVTLGGNEGGTYSMYTVVLRQITGVTQPTCSDSLQNQGETGVDCGGPCTACTVPIQLYINAKALKNTYALGEFVGLSE